MLTKYSENKWKILCLLNLVKPQNLLFKPYCKNNNTIVVTLIFYFEARADKMAYTVLSCVIYTTIKHFVSIDYLVVNKNN